MKPLLAGLLALCLVLGGWAQAKTTVAIMPVENQAHVSAKVREAVRLDIERQLVQSGKVDVIERQKLNALVRELELSQTGLIDPRKLQELGRISGVDAFLFPAITSAWASEKRQYLRIVGADEVTVSAGFAIALKLVETETARILAADKAQGYFKARGVEGVDDIPSKGAALAAARRRAVERAGRVILAALFPVKVAHVSKRTGLVTLNRGKDALRVGQVLGVYALEEPIVDPDTGEVIAHEEVKIGRIKVVEVRARIARARVLEGHAEVGAICR